MHAVQAALQLTASQKDDLMHLRRLFYGKVAQIARQRRDILKRMASSELDLMRKNNKNLELEELTTQLRQNGMEDYRTHIQCTAVMYDGVRLLPCSSCTSCMI